MCVCEPPSSVEKKMLLENYDLYDTWEYRMKKVGRGIRIILTTIWLGLKITTETQTGFACFTVSREGDTSIHATLQG